MTIPNKAVTSLVTCTWTVSPLVSIFDGSRQNDLRLLMSRLSYMICPALIVLY